MDLLDLRAVGSITGTEQSFTVVEAPAPVTYRAEYRMPRPQFIGPALVRCICGTVIGLRENDGDRWTFDEYREHFIEEHAIPAGMIVLHGRLYQEVAA